MPTNTPLDGRCQMAIKAPAALLTEFNRACRQAGKMPTSVVRGFLNAYLARQGEAQVVPEHYRVRHAICRDLRDLALATLTQGEPHRLRGLICALADIDARAAQDSTTSEYRRCISIRRQVMDDLPALVEAGVEVWSMDDELRVIPAGQADRHLSVRIAQYPELELVTQRWLKWVLTGDAGRSVSLIGSIMEMLELPEEARKAFGSPDYHRITRTRACVRADKRVLELLGITFSGRADDVVSISRMAKGL